MARLPCLLSSSIEIAKAIDHFVPQLVVRANWHAIDFTVDSAIGFSQLRKPSLMRQKEGPEPVQELHVFVDRGGVVVKHEEVVDSAVFNRESQWIQMMPKLGGPNQPVACLALILVNERLYKWTIKDFDCATIRSLAENRRRSSGGSLELDAVLEDITGDVACQSPCSRTTCHSTVVVPDKRDLPFDFSVSLSQSIRKHIVRSRVEVGVLHAAVQTFVVDLDSLARALKGDRLAGGDLPHDVGDVSILEKEFLSRLEQNSLHSNDGLGEELSVVYANDHVSVLHSSAESVARHEVSIPTFPPEEKSAARGSQSRLSGVPFPFVNGPTRASSDQDSRENRSENDRSIGCYFRAVYDRPFACCNNRIQAPSSQLHFFTFRYRSRPIPALGRPARVWGEAFWVLKETAVARLDYLARSNVGDSMTRASLRLLIGILAITSAAVAQNIQQNYWQAAQAYNNAAAQCQNAAGAACLRQNASYYQCLGNAMQAGGPSINSCGAAPSCSSSCTGSPSTGAVSPGAGSGQLNPFCNDPANKAVGLMLQNVGACGGGLSPTALKFNAIQKNLQMKQQMVNNAGNAIFGIVSLFGHNNNAAAAPPDSEIVPEPDPAAVAAAQQSQINADASALLASVNALVPGGAPDSPAQPNPNAALSALLDDTPAANTSSAAINSLLGDSNRQDTGTGPATNAVNNLLAENDAPSPANRPQPGDPLYQPPPIDKNYGAGLTSPMQDQQMAVDLSDSIDQPNPCMFPQAKEALQSEVTQIGQEIKDGFNNLIAPAKSLVAPIVNDPGVQAAYQVISGGGTTMPLTQPGDSADTMIRNTYGQATAGGINLVKGPSGLRTYLENNVNQGGADLGWAQANIQSGEGVQP